MLCCDCERGRGAWRCNECKGRLRELHRDQLDSLDDLLEAMLEGVDVGPWDDLPVFGGEDPEDTRCVWSWDVDRMIVGTCADDLEIVSREPADVRSVLFTLGAALGDTP